MLLAESGRGTAWRWGDDRRLLPDEPATDEWVQCERRGCGKWRRLPTMVSAAKISQSRFVCSMSHWLPNPSCLIPDDHTATTDPYDFSGSAARDGGAAQEAEHGGNAAASRPTPGLWV